jgi:lysophospholipase L1-like esterase
MKTVSCFGASLTAGRVSFDYLELLRARPSLAGYQFINRGIDGELAWNGLQRLDEVIADQPDYVSILMGTNDVNATLSERNRLRYLNFNHLPAEPTLDSYVENMSLIVGRLKHETDARISLLSLALIGEDLDHEANQKVRLYNEALRRIATDEKLDYLPLYERMVDYLHAHEADRATLPPMLAYKDGFTNVGNAIALHDSGLSWDEVSHRNGLQLTTDCLHLNRIGASMVADLIENWLLVEGQPPA